VSGPKPLSSTGIVCKRIVLSLGVLICGVSVARAQFVSQRRREIGLRIALGASPSDVLTQVVRQGITVVAVGVGVGLASAFALARLMASLVFGISPRDPLTFATVPLLLALIAALAAFVPARRAVRLDPMRALRED